ncbi:hypothetical protein IAI10_15360 [Clostridium sp. 19966]|uniref:hypothetical protein n=1 Tax=Clostridium sp. 19966 TaxID=2768166 RepID=UPI0028DF0327|nr:hypothetical protein [Clostridium sp. 19966]MDT8718043.1 hypothetical protein [Clostridium sp. 19966]
MQRKKELYEKMKQLERELKGLTEIVKYDDTIASEDEIHGWSMRMDGLINSLEQVRKDILEFHRN